MKTVKNYLETFESFERIQDPDGLMDVEVHGASFAFNQEGGLNAKGKYGRVILQFFVLNGDRILLMVDKTNVTKWGNKGEFEVKPLKKMILKVAK